MLMRSVQTKESKHVNWHLRYYSSPYCTNLSQALIGTQSTWQQSFNKKFYNIYSSSSIECYRVYTSSCDKQLYDGVCHWLTDNSTVSVTGLPTFQMGWRRPLTTGSYKLSQKMIQQGILRFVLVYCKVCLTNKSFITFNVDGQWDITIPISPKH